MPTYHQCVLPSGICIRLKALKTRDQLDIARDLKALGKADDAVESQLESLVRCIVAHTAKQKWIFKKDDKGEPTDIVDTDAMLAEVKPTEWLPDNPLSLKAEGTSLLDLLSYVPDYSAACRALSIASGFGEDRPLVRASLQTVSVG